MHPPKSKIQQHRARTKSGGKECLPQALPQGQTPGKNSWDYSVLSKMNLEPLADEKCGFGLGLPGLVCGTLRTISRLTAFALAVHQSESAFHPSSLFPVH